MNPSIFNISPLIINSATYYLKILKIFFCLLKVHKIRQQNIFHDHAEIKKKILKREKWKGYKSTLPKAYPLKSSLDIVINRLCCEGKVKEKNYF